MKKTMRKLIMSIVLLIAALCGAAGATFAWFTAGDSAGRVAVTASSVGVVVVIQNAETVVQTTIVRSESAEADFTTELAAGEYEAVLTNLNPAEVTVAVSQTEYTLPPSGQIRIALSGGEIRITFKA